MELFLNDFLGKITLETDRVNSPKAVIILAHGAGAGMQHSFMIRMSKELVNYNFNCVRFNFPYMEQGKKFPGSPKYNIATWGIVIDHICSQFPEVPIYISGKSYGGRMGSHYLAESKITKVKGIIYLGFPLHAIGKESKDRASHLTEVNQPQLFLQGRKDKLANSTLMKEVVDNLEKAKMIEIDHADHSFNVPKKSGLTQDEVIEQLILEIDKWM